MEHAGPIWMGVEPTFTDRFSWRAEWQTAALGKDKQERARQMMAQLARGKPGSVILRSRGRQYPNEPEPRWSFGIYGYRDGRPFYSGPSDPLMSPVPGGNNGAGPVENPGASGDVPAGTYRDEGPRQGPAWDLLLAGADRETVWANQVQQLAQERHWHAHYVPPSFDSFHRFLLSHHVDVSEWKRQSDPLSWLKLLEAEPRELSDTVSDTLAEAGVFLLLAGACPSEDAREASVWQLELPAFRSCEHFRQLLEIVAAATSAAGWDHLILTGCPPPVDETVYWTTITPDPGVLEVNMAPASSLDEFCREQRLLHQAAQAVGLDPRQLMFNGQELDSGGGQHLTFGGPSPEASPFFRYPLLLARLIAFLNHHPSLSYWFAGRSVGSSGQSPRVDEVTVEAVDGLGVALDLLARQASESPGDTSPPLTPDQLWSSLSPFLTDRFGNTHRSEVNVEKLWSPHFGDRGRLGLVELRAFRMLATPEDTVAVVMLLRSLLALLAEEPEPLTLKYWGEELHDRYGLPYYLEQDLQCVLQRLDGAGLGIPDPIRATLLDDSYWQLAQFSWQGATVQLRRGIEFWPLIGDHSIQSMQYATFRQVDASTARVEIRILLPTEAGEDMEAGDDTVTGGSWEIGVEGYRLPLTWETKSASRVLVGGVRYKAFQPETTIFPLAQAVEPLVLEIRSPAGMACRFAFHGWRPEGGEYDGLPKDLAEARARTRERLVIQPTLLSASLSPLKDPPKSAVSPCCLDTRRLPLKRP
jgi:uncharacterized protein (DUF2126 family)